MLRYFFTPKSNYDKFGPEWSERYMLSLINRTDSTAYFVAVTAPGEDVTLDAQEMKAPSMDFREANAVSPRRGRNCGHSTLNSRAWRRRRSCLRRTLRN